MTEADARAIAAWRYESIYRFCSAWASNGGEFPFVEMRRPA